MPGAISPQGGRLQATRRRLPGAKPQNSVNQPYSLNLNFIFFQTMSFYRKAYSEKFGVWYPEAVIVGQPVPVKTVARRLSQMCTVTYADVMAVLGELPGVMADYMGQGKSVRLDGLGTFRYTLHTKGVADEADFDFQKQLRAVRVQFVPNARAHRPRAPRPRARWCPPASSGWPTTLPSRKSRPAPLPAGPPNPAARIPAATAASDECNG